MHVLIDTDVTLDLMLKRPAFFADAFALRDLVRQRDMSFRAQRGI